MASKFDIDKVRPQSDLGSRILNYMLDKNKNQNKDNQFYKIVIGNQIRKFQKYKEKGIIENDSSDDEEESLMSDESDMAIDTKNKQRSDYLSKSITLPGTKVAFDREVLELLVERHNIKQMEIDIKKKIEEETRAKLENQSVDDMYSDIEDDNLDVLKSAYTSQQNAGGAISDLLGSNNMQSSVSYYNQQVSDLVKAIEERREKEKEEKKSRDIKAANVDDYFKGFSSTITNKVKNEKKIRSVLQETIDSGKQLTEEQELAEIQKRFQSNSDYMECFPMEHDNIKGFDESDFGEKVKQKFYDEEVIKKDTEWMNSERKTYGFNAKEKDTANRKRDNKYKRKIEKDTEQVSNYMNSNQGY